jgi:hypothetical protein
MGALLPRGYWLYARALSTTPLWTDKPAAWFKIVMHIFTETEWRKDACLKPGQSLISFDGSLSDVSRHQWQRCLRWLSACDRTAIYAITCERCGREQLVNLVNWGESQTGDSYMDNERTNKRKGSRTGMNKEQKAEVRAAILKELVQKIKDCKGDEYDLECLRSDARSKYSDMGANAMGFSVWGEAAAVCKYQARTVAKKITKQEGKQ